MSSAIQSTVIEYLGLRITYPIQISQDDEKFIHTFSDIISCI